jgi:hypothetical protein
VIDVAGDEVTPGTQMRTVGWPDPVSPGIAPFRMDVPAHWSAVEPDDGLIAFLAPAVDGFRISVLVSGRRVPADKELGELAEEPLISAGSAYVDERPDPSSTMSGASRTVVGKARWRTVRHPASR